MRNFIYITLLFSILLSCKNQPAAKKSVKESTKTFQKLTTVKKSEPISNRNLEFNNSKFNIKAFKTNDNVDVTISSTGSKSISKSFKGTFLDCEIGDLNKDGYPEIFIYTMDSKNQGGIIAYTVDNNHKLNPIYFPSEKKDEKIYDGYNGNDSFALFDDVLIQRFLTETKEHRNRVKEILYKMKDHDSYVYFEVESIHEF